MKEFKCVEKILPTKNGNKAWLTVVCSDGTTQAVRTKFVESLRQQGEDLDIIELTHHKKGDYIFGVDNSGKPIGAPANSSKVHEEGENKGNPLYLAGDTPQWSEAGVSVTGFKSMAAFEKAKKFAALNAM